MNLESEIRRAGIGRLWKIPPPYKGGTLKMMKKRLAVIMLAGMMMSLSPVGAMAAETEVTTDRKSVV